MASPVKQNAVNYDEIRSKWIADVDIVVNQLTEWFNSHDAHPAVRRPQPDETLTEDDLGTYQIPSLDVSFSNDARDAITVEPAARNYPGRGVIEVTAWPTLRRVYLVQSDNMTWTIYTDSNIPLRQPWSEETFHHLIDDLRADLYE